MNDGGGDGAGCFDIKEWADTTELTNVGLDSQCKFLFSTFGRCRLAQVARVWVLYVVN